jgi:hypothetical protein
VGPSWATLVPALTDALDTDASPVTLAADVAAAVAEVRRRVPTPTPQPGTGS